MVVLVGAGMFLVVLGALLTFAVKDELLLLRVRARARAGRASD